LRLASLRIMVPKAVPILGLIRHGFQAKTDLGAKCSERQV
jgi:hypothetical protein